jgi:hypothetical protein
MTVTTEVIGDRQVEVHQVEIEPVRVRVLPDDSLDSNNAAKYLDRKPKTLAMWRIIHAHANECWDHTPRLNVRAPEKQCGKTTLLDVLMPLVPRAMKTENVSTAVVFRAAAAYKPTLLVDECDTQLCGKDADKELVSILNAGHGRSGRAFRCEGDDNRIKGFPVFGPAVLAGIGHLPGTLADRSIPIVLQRRRLDQAITPFRSSRAKHLEELASQIARWVSDHTDDLAGSEPDMPPGIFNRLADVWRPIFGIADKASGAWPERARQAALTLTRETGQDRESIKVMVLSDIRDLFELRETNSLSSASICADLAEMTDKPWPEFRNGKPITQRQLASLLTPFGIATSTIRTAEGQTPKGYKRQSFEKVFAAYLTPISSATPPQPKDSAGFSDFRSATNGQDVADRNLQSSRVSAACGGVADKNGGYGAQSLFEADSEGREAIQAVDGQALCVQCRRSIKPDDETIPVAGRGEIHAHCYDDWFEASCRP